MKTILSILLLVNIVTALQAQPNDEYQPDSVYRLNRVKTRTMFFSWDKANWRSVDHFDKYGRHIDHYDYDSSGVKCIFMYKFLYDSNSTREVKQLCYRYGKFDTLKRTFSFSEKPDTLIGDFYTDSAKRITSKVMRHPDGKLFSEVFYSYQPFTIHEIFYINDTVKSKVYTVTDEHFKDKNAMYTYYRAGGIDSAVSIFKYKNTYDKAGNLTRRIIKSDTNEASPFFINRQEYQYTSGNLLSRKTSFLANKSGWIQIILFDYKFW